MTELNGIYPSMYEYPIEHSPVLEETKTRPELNLEEYMQLIIKVAKINKRQGVDIADAISIATIALHNAWLHFDESRGVKFTTYAIQAMKYRIWNLKPDYDENSIQLDERKLKAPVNRTDEKVRLRKLVSDKIELLNTREQFIVKSLYGIDCEELTQQELAKVLGINQQRVSYIKLRALNRLKNLLNSD